MEIKRKWECRIICTATVLGKKEDYLVQRFVHHHNGGDWAIERLVEMSITAGEWLDGLSKTFREKIESEKLKDGKFNVHYKWNPESYPETWVDIDTITSIRFDIYAVKILEIFGKEHRKEKLVASQGLDYEEKLEL